MPLIVCAGLLLSACGGSDSSTAASSSSSGGGGETTTAKFTGEPIVIGTNVPIESQLQSAPQIPAALEAAARAINAEGGIAGREVQIESCDGKGDPNAEVACARKMRQAGVTAEIGELVFLNPAGVLEELAKGEIASLAPVALSPAQFELPNSFPIDFPNGEYVACLSPSLLKAAGKSNVGAALADLAVSKQFVGMFKAATGTLGTKYVGQVFVPPTATDFAPPVQELENLGTEFAILGMSPTPALGMINAATSAGKEWGYCSADGLLTGGQLTKLGAGAEGYYQGATLPAPSAASELPLLQEFLDQMKAEEEAGNGDASTEVDNYNSSALRAWLGMYAFRQVAESMEGPITNKTFLAALSKATVNFGGVIPTIDFAKPQGQGEFKRVFNGRVFGQRWNAAEQQFEGVPGTELDALKAMGVG
ncbi:MAG: ABC transporter substrate-binding protein [Actinobacteria bacterium]|nr:ABC transporter substrate-binding protein [Actinomycetota bacterium]